MRFTSAFHAVCDERIEYFQQYTYEHPIVMSVNRYEELQRLGQLLYTAIAHVADHYREYQAFMPLSEQDQRIIETCRRHPHRVGTFRTDFVVDADSRIQIIEITTRQPLNGYFTSGIFREIALAQAQRHGVPAVHDVYPRFLEYLEHYIGDAERVCVIKGHERLEEFKLYPAIFEQAGLPCHVIPYEELPASTHLLERAWVIEELTFNEIRQLPLDMVDCLTRARMHNDIRTIFFAHDKRFFYLLGQQAVRDAIFSAEEQALLSRYLTPTYVPGSHAEVWDDAYHHREGYILKHQHYGKSVQVFAGLTTDDATWKALLDSPDIATMVLQPFIPPRKFTGRIGEERREDYVAGTLLYFNREFFGPGLYRASSLPVTNQGDDRKIAPLIAAITPEIPGINYLP